MNAIKSLKKKVLFCLEKYPETRNCDRTLCLQIIKEFYSYAIIKGQSGKEEYIPLKYYYSIPTHESVKRIRAKIQNKEFRFLPTDIKVVKKRRINEDRWRKELGYEPKSYFDY